MDEIDWIRVCAISEIKTAKDLIEYLQTLPLDTKVYVSHVFIDLLGGSTFNYPNLEHDKYLNHVIL